MYIHEAIFNAAYKQAGSLMVTDIRIGLGYTAVELEHKLLGLSYSFIKEITPASCNVLDEARGQVFTDEPSNFSGTIKDSLSLKLDTNRNRAIVVATINAVLRYLGMTEKYRQKFSKEL